MLASLQDRIEIFHQVPGWIVIHLSVVIARRWVVDLLRCVCVFISHKRFHESYHCRVNCALNVTWKIWSFKNLVNSWGILTRLWTLSTGLGDFRSDLCSWSGCTAHRRTFMEVDTNLRWKIITNNYRSPNATSENCRSVTLSFAYASAVPLVSIGNWLTGLIQHLKPG